MFPVPVRILRPCVALALASALPLWACSVDPAAETAALQARGLQAGPEGDLAGAVEPDLMALGGQAGGDGPTDATAHLPAHPDVQQVVYTHDRVMIDGEVVESVETGELDADLRARVARPWLFVDEGVVYDEIAETVVDEDGRTVRRYAIVATEIEPILVEPEIVGGPAIDDELLDLADRLAADEPVPVVLGLSTPRPRALPLAPAAGRVSFADAAAMAGEREAAREAREAAFAERSEVTDAIAAIVDLGGVVRRIDGGQRIVVAIVPAHSVPRLTEVDAMRSLRLDATIASQGSMFETKTKWQTNTQQFDDLGYNGEVGGSADTLVGVGEVSGLENEACFFDDGPSDDCDPSERLNEMFDCTGSGCTSITNFVSSEGSHGTVVSSIIAADYTQGQGSTKGIGDGQVAGWESLATGMARETDVHYYMLGTSSSDAADGMDCASGSGSDCRLVDVWNGSYGSTTGGCSPHSAGVGDNAAEDLYDSGALVVMSAGNTGGLTTSTTCTVNSPADTPKAFAVGGLEPNGRAYNTWGRMDYPSSKYSTGRGVSSRGGASVKIGGSWRSGTSTNIDLAAIGEDVDYVTSSGGAYGNIAHNTVGTSMAAPVVAGAAASVKDWNLQVGATWIDSPGRLHTLMLAMGDRGTLTGHEAHASCDKGSELVCGGDYLLGFGRLKLRLLDSGAGMGPVRTHMHTKTHTNSTSSVYRYVPWSGGLGTGTAMVKCVLNQYEDMSGKNDMSLISLRVRVRDKVDGTCVPGEGTIRLSRFDALFDDKHHVTVLDSEVNLDGKCIEVEHNRSALSSYNGVTTSTFCYAAGILDDAAP